MRFLSTGVRPLMVAVLCVTAGISQDRDRQGADAQSASGSASSPAVLDRIAVVVGTTVITETEVIQEARLEAFLNGTPLDLSPAARRTAAERLVDQQLIRNEMRIGAYPQPTGAEIDDMLRSLKQERFHNNDAEHRGALDRYGIDEETLRRHLAWQLSAIRFTDLRFSPAVAGVTEDGQSANRATDGANRPADVDQRLDAWLKETRAGTRVQFKPGAFQ